MRNSMLYNWWHNSPAACKDTNDTRTAKISTLRRLGSIGGGGVGCNTRESFAVGVRKLQQGRIISCQFNSICEMGVRRPPLRALYSPFCHLIFGSVSNFRHLHSHISQVQSAIFHYLIFLKVQVYFCPRRAMVEFLRTSNTRGPE